MPQITIINGSQNSGKTQQAILLAEKKSNIYLKISYDRDYPSEIQAELKRNMTSFIDTVIIDNFIGSFEKIEFIAYDTITLRKIFEAEPTTFLNPDYIICTQKSTESIKEELAALNIDWYKLLSLSHF